MYTVQLKKLQDWSVIAFGTCTAFECDIQYVETFIMISSWIACK